MGPEELFFCKCGQGPIPPAMLLQHYQTCQLMNQQYQSLFNLVGQYQTGLATSIDKSNLKAIFRMFQEQTAAQLVFNDPSGVKFGGNMGGFAQNNQNSGIFEQKDTFMQPHSNVPVVEQIKPRKSLVNKTPPVKQF
jgi:hypothetical protein